MAIINSSPAPYPNKNTEEMESVFKLLDLLDKKIVKPDVQFLDKVPNTDGSFTIVDRTEVPIGKIDVQVKTLPDVNVANPKLQVALSFLSACEHSSLPVVLIVVNERNSIAYWLHINREFLELIAPKITGNSTVIMFPKENVIRKDTNEYIKRWTEIVTNHNRKLIEYDLLVDKIKELENNLILLKNFPRPIHSISAEQLEKLQHFIDTLNFAYHNEFKIVKESYYEQYWKIGIGYSRFEIDSLAYVLYPIKKGENDLLIREIPYPDTFGIDVIRWVAISNDNPIMDDPRVYAYSLVQKQVLEIIQKKYIKLVNEVLAFEHVLQYVDNFYSSFGLIAKRGYNLDVLLNKIHVFYPIWYEEYCKVERIESTGGIIRFDIDEVSYLSATKNIKIITQRAILRYRQKQLSQLQVQVGNAIHTDNNYLINSLSFLVTNKVHRIKRLYPAFEFDKAPKRRPFFIWELISPKNLTIRVRNIYTLIPSLVDEFIIAFFPALIAKIKFFDSFDRLIINVLHKTGVSKFEDSPTIEKIFLKSVNDLPNSIQVFQNGTGSPITYRDAFAKHETGIIIDGEQYKVISACSGTSRRIMSAHPIQELLFEILEDRFSNYFQAAKKNN